MEQYEEIVTQMMDVWVPEELVDGNYDEQNL